MFNIQKMMQQAQKMQDDMKKVQTEMENTKFTGTAGGKSVTVIANGKYEFLEVKISEEAAADREMLEDLMLAALKDVSNQISESMEKKMGSITSGLNIPGLQLPF